MLVEVEAELKPSRPAGPNRDSRIALADRLGLWADPADILRSARPEGSGPGPSREHRPRVKPNFSTLPHRADRRRGRRSAGCRTNSSFNRDPAGRRAVRVWRYHRDLAPVRDPASLPPAERAAWTEFWAKVDAIAKTKGG